MHRETFWRRGFFFLLAVSLAYGFYCLIHLAGVPAHSGVDQNGYLVGGKMFADHFSTRMSPPLDLTDPAHIKLDETTYIGNMWIGADLGKSTERYYPKYPIGLPVLVAIALKIGGAAKGVAYAHLISPISTALALIAIFLLIRHAAGSFAGILGILIVAGNPMALGLANNPNSHASTICFVCWGMYFLIRWWQKAGFWRAALAGLLLGYAVTIRYTEALLLFPLYPLEVVPENHKVWHTLFYAVRLLPIGPIGIVILCNLHWRRLKSYLQSATLLACWAIPVALLVWHNKAGFGKVTGYDPTNESDGFRWEYFLRNWETMLRQMHNMGLFFILPLGLAGQLLLCVRRPAFGLVMLLWTIPSLVLYTFYYWAPDTTVTLGYLRFFLTIVPPLTLGAVWLLTEAIHGLGKFVPESTASPESSAHESSASLRRSRRIALQLIAAAIIIGGAVIGFYFVHKNEAITLSDMSVASIGSYLSGAKGVVIVMAALALAFIFHTKAATAGLIVAVAVGIGADFGLETIETEFQRSLAASIAGDHILDKVPARSVIFSSDQLLNHLQFIGDFRLYSNRTFGGIGARAVSNTNDPQTIQPDRAKMWAEMMRGKTPQVQITWQRSMIAAAIEGNHRVFIALPTLNAENFKRTLAGASRTDALVIDSKTISTWTEPTLLRRGGAGGGRNARGGAGRNPGIFGAFTDIISNTSWELVELTLGKPAPPVVVPARLPPNRRTPLPAPPPTSRPTPPPTTRTIPIPLPVTRPATKPTTAPAT